MSLTHSPSIITNGLIFYYDMNNTQKSWKGMPTVNQYSIPTPDSSGNVTFPINGSGTFQRVYTGIYGGYAIKPTDIVYKYVLGLDPTGCHYHGNTINISMGQSATWSFDYYITTSVTGYPVTNYLANMESSIGISGYISDSNTSIVGVWKRGTFTSSPASSTGTFNAFLYPGACGSQLATGGFILFKNPQVEINTFATPFVAGTRSNTQSIIDLTGNSTITANSLTYASDGTFSFNGSSDRITASTSLFNRSNGQELTVSCWIKPSRNGGQYSVFCTNRSDDTGTYNWIFYQHTSDGAISFHGSAQNKTTYIPALNTWINVTNTVKSNGDSILYVNGNPVYTATGFTYGGQPSRLGIGADPGGQEPFQGSMGAVNIYNRALTASEVKQNFNAMRRRYGL